MAPFFVSDPSTLPPLPAEEEASLRDALKRCSEETYTAARVFRATGDPRRVPVIVQGIIERFVEGPLRPKLLFNPNELRLSEDLGLDSLTMMELVILVEDVLKISIHNEELRGLRTLGDVQRFVETKLSSLPTPAEGKAGATMAVWPQESEEKCASAAARAQLTGF
ncbi:acyl carrier protein [Opitutaceae bacterium EW11]|nr:acyl carrier protein [Opitutaceae bacterium EW11]